MEVELGPEKQFCRSFEKVRAEVVDFHVSKALVAVILSCFPPQSQWAIPLS